MSGEGWEKSLFSSGFKVADDDAAAADAAAADDDDNDDDDDDDVRVSDSIISSWCRSG